MWAGGLYIDWHRRSNSHSEHSQPGAVMHKADLYYDSVIRKQSKTTVELYILSSFNVSYLFKREAILLQFVFTTMKAFFSPF